MRASLVAAMRVSPTAAMRATPRAAIRASPASSIRATPAAQFHSTTPAQVRARARKTLFGHHDQGMLPRMSWNVHNLYNILNRTFNPRKRQELFFSRTNQTIFQQHHRAKRFCRGYHGDWIQERRYKRYFVPLRLPAFNPTHNSAGLNKGAKEKANLANQAVGVGGYMKAQSPFSADRGQYSSDSLLTAASESPPVAQLFVRDVERGLDVVVHRACFAGSVYKARSMIIGGHVKLNGITVTKPGILLEPGDLVQVAPSRIPFLRYTEKDLKKLGHAKKAGSMAEAETETVTQEKEVEAEAKAEAAAEDEGKTSKDREAAAEEASSEVQAIKDEMKEEAKARVEKKAKQQEKKKDTSLSKGVRPFTQIPFAHWFLFVPPHLEVSWTTCSVIFMRYPTITVRKDQGRRPGSGFRNRTTTANQGARGSLLGASETSSRNVTYETDIASPFPAAGDVYRLAWEWYQAQSPRTRGQLRRVRLMGTAARHGFVSSRALEAFHLTRALTDNELVDRQSTNTAWLHKKRQELYPSNDERMLTKHQKLTAKLAERARAQQERLESPPSTEWP